ncbi:MAG: Methyltransferase type 12 [Myxococcales bacterium]|nr:Methyltransferase type 12 [Myxococcales bacterium]
MAAAAEGRCFLCGTPAEAVAWRENGYDAVACPCGLTFVRPPASERVVDATFDAHSAAFYRLPARSKVGWLMRQRGVGKLLEVGCGDGWFLEAARHAGVEARGIDANPDRVARARARGLDVRHGLLEETRIDDRFDVVFHCDMLSHFPEPIAALRRMTDLLADEGALFFEVGLLGAPARAWYPRIGGIGLPQHRWLYSDDALAKLFAEAGLRVVASKRFGLACSVWLSQTVRRIAPVAKRLIRGRASVGDTPGSASGPASLPRWRRYADGVQERVESFARYEIGALTPTLGPATLLVLAEPTRRR